MNLTDRLASARPLSLKYLAAAQTSSMSQTPQLPLRALRQGGGVVGWSVGRVVGWSGGGIVGSWGVVRSWGGKVVSGGVVVWWGGGVLQSEVYRPAVGPPVSGRATVVNVHHGESTGRPKLDPWVEGGASARGGPAVDLWR